MINLCNKPSAWKSHWTWILFCWKIHIVIVRQGFKVSLLVQVFFHNRDHNILIKRFLNCLCLLIIQSSMKDYILNISTSPFYSYSIPLLLVYEKQYQVSPGMTLPIAPQPPPPPPSFSPCCNSKKRNENTSHLGFPYIHILSTSHLPTLHINLLWNSVFLSLGKKHLSFSLTVRAKTEFHIVFYAWMATKFHSFFKKNLYCKFYYIIVLIACITFSEMLITEW